MGVSFLLSPATESENESPPEGQVRQLPHPCFWWGFAIAGLCNEPQRQQDEVKRQSGNWQEIGIVPSSKSL
jgi:cobalamin biosynthesis protein CobD/CbiB